MNYIEQRFVTVGGQTIEIRPLTRADVPHLLEIFEHMGPDSRYNRFHEVATHLDDEVAQLRAEEIAAITVEQGRGWIAFVGGPEPPAFPVGAVRYIHVSPGVAEIAVSVRDDYQQQGIGTMLVQHAVAAARNDGLHHLLASILPENTAALQLMRRLELPFTAQSVDGVRQLLLDLEGGSA